MFLGRRRETVGATLAIRKFPSLLPSHGNLPFRANFSDIPFRHSNVSECESFLRPQQTLE